MPDWKAGFGIQKITPPRHVALAGYGLKPSRTAEAVLDDLFVRALVFEAAGRRAVLCTVDLIGLNAAFAINVRARIKKELGIPSEHVLISATHSHSSPTGVFFRQWGALDPEYIRSVQQRTEEAILEAVGRLQDGELGYGEIQAPGHAVNRVRKDGPVDHTLRLLAVRDSGGARPRLLAANFALHPVCMQTDTRIVTADFPGKLVRCLEKDLPGLRAAFFQGALGDINPENLFGGAEVFATHGRELAERSKQALETIAYGVAPVLAGESAVCELPLDLESARREAHAYLFQGRIPKAHEWIAQSSLLREWAVETLGLLASNPPATLACEVQVLRLGDVAVVGLPGEMYTLVGQGIRARSPFKHTIVIGFANGNIGYIADPRDYAEETYAALMTPKIMGYPPFQPHAWETVVNTSAAALERVYRAPAASA